MGKKKKKGKKKAVNLKDPRWESKIRTSSSITSKKKTLVTKNESTPTSKPEKKITFEEFKVHFQPSEEGSKKFVELLKDVLGEKKFGELDLPVVHFLASTFSRDEEAHMSKEREKDLIEVLKKFCDSLSLSKNIPDILLRELNKSGIFKTTTGKPKKSKEGVEDEGKDVKPKVADGVVRLARSVTFSRTLEEEKLKQEIGTLASAGLDGRKKAHGSHTNYNEELDWDEEKFKQIQEKRLLKRQKHEFKKRQAYQQYLKECGVTRQKGIVKIHHQNHVPFGDENRGNHIDVEIDSLSIGGLELLAGCRLQIKPGTKYGLVGRNGVGKTTLMRAICERSLPNIPIHLQILHVEQENLEVDDNLSPVEVLLKTDVERDNLLKEEETLLARTAELENQTKSSVPEKVKEGEEPPEDKVKEELDVIGERLRDIYSRMNDIEVHSAESKAREILYGLSFSERLQNMKCKHLSGGWKKRVSIAKSLFIEPDVLLMDEPSNHLDLHAIIWLENYLNNNWKKSLILISHSKVFLNNICGHIIHFYDKKLSYYKGNFYKFEENRKKKIIQNMKNEANFTRQQKHVQKFIDRFRFKAGRASLVQSRIKMLKKMTFLHNAGDKDMGNLEESRLGNFSFNPSTKNLESYKEEFDNIKDPLIQVINVSFKYDEMNEMILKKCNFILRKNSRVALVGKNGIGKSTFFNLICGTLEPLKGTVVKNTKIRVEVFNQHHTDSLDLALNPCEYLKKCYNAGSEKHRDEVFRIHLGKMGLVGEQHFQPMYTLSGGQKSRVVFAKITFNNPHVLLLDEPSNHLDVDTVDALIYAINNFQGPVVIISHDSYLIKRTCDHIYVLKDQNVKLFRGDFEMYKQTLLI